MVSKQINIHVTSYTDEVIAEVKRKGKMALESIGGTAEGYAKDDSPVDTGRLRNSIAHDEDDNETRVGSNVEYAPFVEFMDRTHKVGKAHFLRDSIAKHEDEYRAIIEAALNA